MKRYCSPTRLETEPGAGKKCRVRFTTDTPIRRYPKRAAARSKPIVVPAHIPKPFPAPVPARIPLDADGIRADSFELSSGWLELKSSSVVSGGRGVFATQFIPKGSFVCEYAGKWRTEEEFAGLISAQQPESQRGNYAFDVKCRGITWYIDAGDELDNQFKYGFGRFLNHSRARQCLDVRTVASPAAADAAADSVPYRVFLFAQRHILQGEELLFDYGERDPRTLEQFPWLQE